MTRIGLDCKLYRNTGTITTPVWNEIINARDVTVPMSKAEADTSRRGSRWRTRQGTLRDASIDFQMIQEDGDLDFAALWDSYLNGTPIELLVLNGPVTGAGSSGSQGLRAWCEVMSVEDGQPLEGAQTFQVTARPTTRVDPGPGANAGNPIPPTWFTVT